MTGQVISLQDSVHLLGSSVLITLSSENLSTLTVLNEKCVLFETYIGEHTLIIFLISFNQLDWTPSASGIYITRSGSIAQMRRRIWYVHYLALIAQRMNHWMKLKKIEHDDGDFPVPTTRRCCRLCHQPGHNSRELALCGKQGTVTLTQSSSVTYNSDHLNTSARAQRQSGRCTQPGRYTRKHTHSRTDTHTHTHAQTHTHSYYYGHWRKKTKVY